jgi:hypothetical protein
MYFFSLELVGICARLMQSGCKFAVCAWVPAFPLKQTHPITLCTRTWKEITLEYMYFEHHIFIPLHSRIMIAARNAPTAAASRQFDKPGAAAAVAANTSVLMGAVPVSEFALAMVKLKAGLVMARTIPSLPFMISKSCRLRKLCAERSMPAQVTQLPFL